MQTQNITTVQKIRAFPWYYGGQTANVVFVLLTWFGPVLPLFLNDLGMNKSKIGVILAIPFFCSLLSLLVSEWVLRLGVKKVFLWGYGIRTFITIGLCAAPAVLHWAGVSAVFIWVTVISLGFSICRAIGETGFLPWSREFIPNHLRGKTDGINSIVCGVVSLGTSLMSALVLKYILGVSGYIMLILLSLPFGLLSVLTLAMVPGGKPVKVEPDRKGFWTDLRALLGDRNFLCYEAGMAGYSLAILGLSFLPLFMLGEVGLGADRILLLSAGFWLGVLSSSYLWGWSADRFGSKPVLLTGLMFISLVPLLFFFTPRADMWSLRVAMLSYFYYGIAYQGVVAGANRYFYVGAVPPNTKNSAYYAAHYAWCGLFAASGPLLAGWLLDACHSLHWTWRFIHVDQFTPLFATIMCLFLVMFYGLRRLRKDGAVQPREFMTMFIQGNPVMAFNSMIRYRFADDEDDRISTTRSMGDAENPLSVAELLEAITDPSFNVRYEAIVAIARMPSHPDLMQALIDVLDSKEPDLSVAAGWALGRIRDKRAVPALRRALASEYALLRSRSARSLAALDDADAVPVLLDLFKREKHDSIRVAYASALGVFRASQALDDLLELLDRITDDSLRSEVALAIVRITGSEHHFVRLWRATRSDFGTGMAEAVTMLRRHIGKVLPMRSEIIEILDVAEQAMGAQDISAGATALVSLIRQLPLERLESNQRTVLQACLRWLAGAGQDRRDCLLLAINSLHAAMASLRRQQERVKTDGGGQMTDG